MRDLALVGFLAALQIEQLRIDAAALGKPCRGTHLVNTTVFKCHNFVYMAYRT